MIFLLNREYILWEVVELARLHMCEVLRVPPAAIDAEIELHGESLSPVFRVDADECSGVDKNEIRKVMGAVYADCRRELEDRLAVAGYTRREYLERFVWNGEEATAEDGYEAATA